MGLLDLLKMNFYTKTLDHIIPSTSLFLYSQPHPLLELAFHHMITRKKCGVRSSSRRVACHVKLTNAEE